jgi:hypothetical protein
MPYNQDHYQTPNSPVAIWIIRNDNAGHDGDCIPAQGTYDPLTDHWTAIIRWHHLPGDIQTRIMNPAEGFVSNGTPPQYMNIYLPASQVTFSPIARLQGKTEPARPSLPERPRKTVRGKIIGLD